MTVPLLWGERRGVHGIGAKRQCEGAQVCAVRKPDEPKRSYSEQKKNITNSERTGKKDNVSDPVFQYVAHLNIHKRLNFFYIFVDFYGYFAVYV